MNTKWKLLIAAAVIVALFMGGCKYGEYRYLKRTTTKVEHDSVVVTSFLPLPILVTNDSIVYKVRTLHDTLETEGEKIYVPGKTVYLPTETPQWVATDLNDYNKTRTYDTALNGKRDTASIHFEVNRNKVSNWKLKLVSHDSTKVITPPKKFVLSVIPTAIGNQYKPIFAYGVGLDFKFPDDGGFNASVLRVPSQPKGKRTIFQLSKKFPIRITIFKAKNK